MDYHILSQSKDQNTVNVIFHAAVPAANNSVGVPWKTALLKKHSGVIASALYGISSAELALIETGEVIEKVETVRFSSIYLTNTQRLQEIKDRYSVARTQLLEELQIELSFMGHEGDV